MKNSSSILLRFWSDPTTQTLSDQAKLLALYLLTGAHINLMGCFHLPIGYMARALYWDIKDVFQRVTELVESGFIAHDKTSDWILIPHFLKWYPVRNLNQAKILRKLFEQIPEKNTFYKALITILLEHNIPFEATFQSQLECLANRFRNQEQKSSHLALQSNSACQAYSVIATANELTNEGVTFEQWLKNPWDFDCPKNALNESSDISEKRAEIKQSECYKQAKIVNQWGTRKLIKALDCDRLTYAAAAALALFSPHQQNKILSWPDELITAFVNHLQDLHQSCKNSSKWGSI